MALLPAAAATGLPGRALLRRLMIICPITGLATDTGFELYEIPRAARSPQTLIDCLECGQDHSWRIEDAVVDRSFE